MKKSNLILFLLASFLYVSNACAQANVLSTGISIQGIARDENNSALANRTALPLTFLIYYKNVSNSEVAIKNESGNVATDNFGVFSYVITITSNLFTQISNQQAYLKVSSGSTVFSDEQLQAVPYAIQAQNGNPTGTIIAYIGATAPAGWLLCNGDSFPDDVFHARLKELLGTTNTPNLNARYLRGTGPVTGREAIALKGTQDDATRPHNHSVNLNTFPAGNHTHDAGEGFNRLSRTNDRYWVDSERVHMGNPLATTNPPNRTNVYETRVVPTTGQHEHSISGSTGDSGNATANETRVYSYGVNYIIKI